MYSPKIIEKRLEAVERRKGFYPQETSIADVESNNDHLASLLLEDNTLARALTKNERDYIENERAMCANNFQYFATRYCWNQHWEGGIRRVNFWKSQQIALDLYGQLEELGRSISVQKLKARQLGMSTLSELAITHRVQFFPETKSLIGSSDPNKSSQMVRMILVSWERMPWWLMPNLTKKQTGEFYEFGGMNSSVVISHGSAMTGIGRGSTFQAFHLSELADYVDAAELVDASLVKATHESPFLIRILESTAKGKGKGNWWHTTWEASKRGYWKGEAKFCPLFLPWYVGEDIYPTEHQRRTRPVPIDWIPGELTLAHANRAKDYVQTSDILRKHLGENWFMPKEQMYYWENERRSYESKNELAKFYEEMPADDKEAFQSSGTSVFNVDLLSDMRERAKAPKAVFAIIGETAEIPLSKHPSEREIKKDLKPIRIDAKWVPKLGTHTYYLVPLNMDNFVDMDLNNKLIVWEFPDSLHDYGIGVDCGYGIGSDRSVMQVMRKGTMWKNPEQVAKWQSDQHNALDMWPLLMAIGTFYTSKRKGRWIQPLIAIETQANGETLLYEVRKRGLSNHHRMKRYDRVKSQKTTNRLGWFTTAWSRSMMLDYFINAVRDGYLNINCPELLDEMGNFAEDESTQKLQATHGYHDDNLMAMAIINFVLSIEDTKGYTTTLAERLAQREKIATKPKYAAEKLVGTSMEDMDKLLNDADGFVSSWGMVKDDGEYYVE